MDIFTRPRHLEGFYRRAVVSWYSRHIRLVRNLLLWLGIPLGLIIAAGFIPFSFDGLKHGAERLVQKTGAASCSIEKVSFTPWLGLSIDGLELTKKDGPVQIGVKIPRVRLSYRIIPLLFRCAVIKDFAVDEPQVGLVLASTAAPRRRAMPFSAEDARKLLAGIPFAVIVQNISVRSGALAVQQRGESLVAGKGIDVRMSVGYKQRLTLAGKVSADRLTVGGMWDVDDFRAAVRISDLTVTLERCKGDFYGGTVSASGEADLGEHTLERFKAGLSHVNLTNLYEACRIRQGRCEGRLDADISLVQSDLSPDSMKGTGNIKLADVSVHELPLQSGLLVFVAVPQIKNITFSRITADLNVGSGKVFTPNIRGDGYPLEVRSEGWVGFDGYFSEKMNGIFARDLVKDFHPVIANSLDDEADGKKSFKCTVHGTLGNPHIDIDRKIQERAVNSVIDQVRKFFGK
jgi:hypothetical protein